VQLTLFEKIINVIIIIMFLYLIRTEYFENKYSKWCILMHVI